MLFDKNREPSCSYCHWGERIGDYEVACSKHGIVAPDSSCRKFRYEPLKREPEHPILLSRTVSSLSDFSLDD